MRVGTNPLKDTTIGYKAYHRIIIPVFVPNITDPYFKNGLEVTQICLESLTKTRHKKSSLTVVNNGSCKEVTHYLQQLYLDGKIDQLIHHKSNIGKIDAVIPVAKTATEPFITISDGDVLFKNGWINAVENVFNNFPEAGMVAPVPNPTFYRVYSENTLFDSFFKGMLKFKSVCNSEDLLAFAKSIGSDTMYKKKSRLYKQLIVKRKGEEAVIGCGHFVATLRKEVFKKAPNMPSHMAYSSDADRDYIDIPNDKAGFWRLATTNCYAYHIGNVPEAWMNSTLSLLSNETNTLETIPKIKKSYVPLFIKKIVNKLWLNQYVRPFIFRYLGLDDGYNEY
jgi:hypothetical protein